MCVLKKEQHKEHTDRAVPAFRGYWMLVNEVIAQTLSLREGCQLPVPQRHNTQHCMKSGLIMVINRSSHKKLTTEATQHSARSPMCLWHISYLNSSIIVRESCR